MTLVKMYIFKDGASGYNGIFTRFMTVEKADHSKAYQNPKRKSGEATHFSEIIELKFGKKMEGILCILKHLLIIISEKCVVTHIFFLDSNGSC